MYTADTASNAFEQVFISHRHSLVNTATRILGCPGLAEDVVQDAYLKCCNGCSSRMRCQMSYITQVVKNLALDYYRRQQVEKRIFAPDEAGEDVADGGSTPERAAIAHQELSAMLSSLAHLPARTCEAFASYYFHERTQSEIARQLGVSTTLVNFLLMDARAALAARGLAAPANRRARSSMCSD